jgi:hypothetical protein
VSQTEYRFSNRCEYLIVIIVTNIKRKVAINALETTRTNQTPRATGTNALFDRVFRERFDDVSRATTGDLRFEIPARFPKSRDVSQPQVRRLDIHRHLSDVMLHVWIVNLVLRGDVVERVIVSSFGGAEKSRSVMRNEARLPAFL